MIDLGAQPPCEAFLTAEQLAAGVERTYPLDVRVCDACLLVQLPAYIPADAIFSEYAYFSSFSDSWVEHARRYVEQVIARFGLTETSNVVEVASNDGYLLQHMVARGIDPLGIEPAANVANVARDRGVPTLTAFFTTELAERIVRERGGADLIVANNVLAHVPDLNDFIRGLGILLAPDGILTLEFPHLLELIEGNQFDTIYHEHFSYFTLRTAEAALARHDLLVFDVERLTTHGGSLRLFVAHPSAQRPASDRLIALRAAERDGGYWSASFAATFRDGVQSVKARLLEILADARAAGQTVVGYGAPGKGNTLLNYCGIGPDDVRFLVDRNTYKHGRFAPGSHLPIYPVERLYEDRPDLILILPWNLRDEIVAQLADARTWGARFLVPIPYPTVID